MAQKQYYEFDAAAIVVNKIFLIAADLSSPLEKVPYVPVVWGNIAGTITDQADLMTTFAAIVTTTPAVHLFNYSNFI